MKPGPKKQYAANLRVRVSAETMERIRRRAEEMGLTVSELLRLTLGEGDETPSDSTLQNVRPQ